MKVSAAMTAGGRESRRVLVIAFHYPPDNSSTGVLRTLKFTQYLREHGWLSHVLTVPETLYENRDLSLLRDVPGDVRVTRVPCFDAKERWGIKGRYPSWTAIPDRYISWHRHAVREGVRIVASGGVDALLSTYPIPTAHLIGLTLSKRTGLPWIADFRDPWAGGGGKGLHYHIDRFLESRVVYKASVVIGNTDLAREDFVNRYPNLDRRKFISLPNGYDESDFETLPQHSFGGDAFTIVYPGLIDPVNRNPEPFLDALGSLIRRGLIGASDVRMRFIGAGPGLEAEWFRRVVTRNALESVVDGVRERVPYGQSLQILASAGLLLVLNEPIGSRRESDLGYSRLMVPAKVYEYLRLGRPFLALCGEGSVPRLLDSLAAGWWCHPEDQAGIEARIVEAVELHRAHRGPDWPVDRIRCFERRALTARLAETLDAITDSSAVVKASTA
jgi:hypothetical protein